MTPAELLAATAADMRRVADASSLAPWYYNSYNAVLSGPLTRGYPAWSDPLFDAGHTLERVGECQPCGKWRDPLPGGVQWSRGHGCRHSAEDYRRGPWVARVPAAAGDSAQGPRQADAVHIATWDPDMARAVADWLDSKAVRYADPVLARRLDTELAQGVEPPMLKTCAAWWASRGLVPTAADTRET